MLKISKLDLLRLYVRSFFVQTGWTYDRMLAFGFAWILSPLAKKLCPSAEEQREFIRRHLVSFNANPYLASYAMGAVIKLEEKKTPPEQIKRFKMALRGPLGALGDNLIWQNFRSALLILGLILTERFGIYGALTIFLIFNLYQMYVRARGMVKGYTLGGEVSSDLTGGHLRNMTQWSGRVGAACLGFVFMVKLAEQGMEPFQPDKAMLFLLFVLFSFWGIKRNLNPSFILLFYLGCFLAIKAACGLI
jgi:mannose/fructose/N-acetylgalactosamine-specific phosphotransferase system component IID